MFQVCVYNQWCAFLGIKYKIFHFLFPFSQPPRNPGFVLNTRVAAGRTVLLVLVDVSDEQPYSDGISLSGGSL